jgi:hypothetical protein
MSSKKSPQKPAEQKPEGETANGTIDTKSAESEGEQSQEEAAAEQKPEGEAAPTPESGDAQDPEGAVADQSSDPVQPPQVTVEPKAVTLASLAVKIDIDFAGDLANRLTKAASAAANSGNPELAQSLNRLDLLVGDLKNALPAAIKATEGEQLSADLTGLLAKL